VSTRISGALRDRDGKRKRKRRRKKRSPVAFR